MSTLFTDVQAEDVGYGNNNNGNTNYNSNNDGMEDNYCNLSKKTRIIGAIVCIIIGIILNSIALGFLFSLQLSKFAILYVLGTFASLGSSFFIAGPKKHIEALKFKPHLIAAIILVCCIILIFIFACGVKIGFLALIFVLVEIVDLLIFNLTLHEKVWEKVKGLFFKCCKCFQKDNNNNNNNQNNNYANNNYANNDNYDDYNYNNNNTGDFM